MYIRLVNDYANSPFFLKKLPKSKKAPFSQGFKMTA